MTRGENLIAALVFHVASERNRSFPPPAEQPGTDCTHIRQLYLSRHTAHSELLLKVEHVAAGGSLQTSFSLSKVCSATGKSPCCFAVFALTHLCLPKNWRLKSLQFPSINSAHFSFSLYFSLFCYEHKHTHTHTNGNTVSMTSWWGKWKKNVPLYWAASLLDVWGWECEIRGRKELHHRRGTGKPEPLSLSQEMSPSDLRRAAAQRRVCLGGWPSLPAERLRSVLRLAISWGDGGG